MSQFKSSWHAIWVKFWCEIRRKSTGENAKIISLKIKIPHNTMGMISSMNVNQANLSVEECKLCKTFKVNKPSPTK